MTVVAAARTTEPSKRSSGGSSKAPVGARHGTAARPRCHGETSRSPGQHQLQSGDAAGRITTRSRHLRARSVRHGAPDGCASRLSRDFQPLAGCPPDLTPSPSIEGTRGAGPWSAPDGARARATIEPDTAAASWPLAPAAMHRSRDCRLPTPTADADRARGECPRRATGQATARRLVNWPRRGGAAADGLACSGARDARAPGAQPRLPPAVPRQRGVAGR